MKEPGGLPPLAPVCSWVAMGVWAGGSSAVVGMPLDDGAAGAGDSPEEGEGRPEMRAGALSGRAAGSWCEASASDVLAVAVMGVVGAVVASSASVVARLMEVRGAAREDRAAVAERPASDPAVSVLRPVGWVQAG